MPVEGAAFGTLSLITLLLFVGATGKSAQIPLYVWLPDAMEGPTPVSALIHAATMVTAGVYMVGRNAVLFGHSPMTMEVVAVVGVATAFMAATIGLVQNDIKRVLAYSTVSQLGFMFLAMGVGAYAAGAFHLMTHAFFKALLFLCSGSVIHAMAGQQDMRHMGGLKKYMPVTYMTMLIGTLAIAGMPPLSGFFSKDEILFKTFLEHKVIWGVAVVTALMTAFYMYRLMSMTFFGSYRGPAWEHGGARRREHGAGAHGAGHARERRRRATGAMARPARVAEVDDDSAADSGGRGGDRRLRRHPGRAGRRQRHRALLGTELHRSHGRSRPRRRRPDARRTLSEVPNARRSRPAEHAVTPSPSSEGGPAQRPTTSPGRPRWA